MNATILIVDDDASIRKGLSLVLHDKYAVITAANGSEAIALFQRERPDIVLLDVGLPEIDGVEVLQQIKQNDPNAAVIMVTAVEEVKTIVKAVKLGAYDYLVKPIGSQELLLTIQHALENKDLKNQIKSIQQSSINKYKVEMIGNNATVKNSIAIAGAASKSSETPILITGESGVGKGVLAKIAHYNSREVPGPFVTVNCGAIAKDLVESELFGYERGAFTGARADGSKGRFEEARGGTIFLDEIGAMPLAAQVKLLAVLEDRVFYRIGGSRQIKVSARIMAATNKDLESAVGSGEFRSDLFFRLNVVRLDLPPLRQRPEDILLLTKHFLEKFNAKFSKNFKDVSPEAQAFLLDYPWPGNVRELRNTIERITLVENSNTLKLEHLRVLDAQKQDKTNGLTSKIVENELDYNEVTKNLIKETMKIAGGNVTEAARLMNMPSYKLRYRIKKYGLNNQLN